jgi:predicted outer membrane protein
MRYLRIGIVSLMAGFGLLGCSGENGPSSEPSSAPVLAGSNDDPKGDRGNKGDKNKRLDDFQIATVLHVVNQGEIKEARFALKRATRPDVRDFASRMEMDHKMADEKLRALFGDAVESVDRADDDTAAAAPEWDSPPDSDLPVAPSKISRLFKYQTMLDLHQLRGIAPPDFDLGYIAKQVAAHAGVLGVADQHLLPSVQKPELRQLIEETRPKVVSHLESATAITRAIISDSAKGHPHVQ